jgi:hypothetical protein
LLHGYSTIPFDLGGNNADTTQAVLQQAGGNIVLVGQKKMNLTAISYFVSRGISP